MPRLALKVDVDTHDGMRSGVPRLADLFRGLDIRATFFISFGPDNSGKAVWRAFRKAGFVRKMLRTNPARCYGWRTMLSGTLLPARPIGTAFPDILRSLSADGHEIGVHAWDHVLWQDHLPEMTRQAITEQFHKAFGAYADILNQQPRAVAAPGWIASPESLAVQDSLSLEYCSDCRGHEPFLPVMDGIRFHTPQAPTSLPTLDEELGRNARTAAKHYQSIGRKAQERDWHVYTIHAETEGMAFAEPFEEFLSEFNSTGLHFCTLGEYLKAWKETGGALAEAEVKMGTLPGRAGAVAVRVT